MELQINEYVRTKQGVIDYITNYAYGSCVYRCYNGMCIDECNTTGTPIKDICSHSFKVLDLLKPLDIIEYKECTNGDYGTEVGKIYAQRINTQEEVNNIKDMIHKGEIQLVSILTKEQFEQRTFNVNIKGGDNMILSDSVMSYSLTKDQVQAICDHFGKDVKDVEEYEVCEMLDDIINTL